MRNETERPAYTTAEDLGEALHLTQEEKTAIERVRARYAMRVPRYYAGLIDPGDAASPLRRQCVPSPEELENPDSFQDDPLNEGEFSPVPHMAHKYPDRAAIFLCNACFMYCRHCTRKNTVIKGGSLTRGQFDDIVRYIERTPAIRDVLLTGGDPLTLCDEALDECLGRLRAIKHVLTLRIGTRAPVVQPDRITERLADMLSKHHPLWVNTHFNHPDEITKESARACDILLSRGIPLGNQTVLLKGVNDDADTMERLMLGLIRIRVRPYYIYQCDCVRGTAHFHTPYRLGMDIVQALRARVSGYAVPRFIIDVPGARGGKIVMEHANLLSDEGDHITLRALDGQPITYQTGGQP